MEVLDERFVVFCRERKSYDYLAAGMTKAKIILDHDMAFRLTGEILKARVGTSDAEKRIIAEVAQKLKGVPLAARFMREDCESVGGYETDMDLSGFVYGSEMAPKDYIRFAAKLMLAAVDSVEAVITDRLHVGIAGAFMGKETYLLDNSYGKLSSVYAHSLADNPLVHFVAEMPEGLRPRRATASDLKRFSRVLGQTA
jgi:exopolysaccharide biosynthesis predicted pyruvyltransferase EpsI